MVKRLAYLLTLLAPGAALAHPVDEVVQGAYLTLARGEVRLELDLTPGTEVADIVLKSLDANGDKAISGAEGRAYGERVLKQSTLALGGKAAAWRLDRVSMPPYEQIAVETATIKVYAIAQRPDRAGAQSLSYANSYQPARSQWIANIFLQPGGGWKYRVTGQKHTDDGRGLAVSYVVGR
jgi:hypothetical protein